MRSRVQISVAVALVVAINVGQAGAQTEPGRGYISANGAFQTSTTEFDSTFSIVRNAETGSVETSYTVPAAPAFNISGGVRIWKNLALGVGVSRFVKADDGSVDASIPHPFFFNKNRLVTGTVPQLQREETATHVQAVWMVPVSSRLSVAISGGPSLFSVKQVLIEEVEYTESYPYDTATFSGATTRSESTSHVGFNAGADITYMLSRNVGIGGGVQLTRATVDLATPDGDTVTINAGGPQVGAGVRLRF